MTLIRKLFGNLALDFILLLVLAALVSVSSLLGLTQVDADYQSLVNHSFEIERLAAKIRTDLLEAIRLENGFLLNVEREGFDEAYENYIVAHNQYTASLEQDLQQLANLVSQHEVLGDEKVEEDLNNITDIVITYEEDFARLITFVEARGNELSGHEGEFSSKATELEQLFETYEDQMPLHIALLKMRFSEERYLVDRSSRHAAQVNFQFHELFGEVEEATITRLDKVKIKQLLEAYKDSLTRVVAVDSEILALEQEINDLVFSIETLTNDIDAIARQEASIQMNHAANVADQTIQLVAMSVVVILVFGSGLGVAMAFQLRKEKDIRVEPNTFTGSETA